MRGGGRRAPSCAFLDRSSGADFLLPGQGTADTLHGRRAFHHEATCTPAFRVSVGRLSGYGPHGRNMEPACMEWATVGGGSVGRRHRVDWLVGMEAVEGEEGLGVP